MPSRDNRGSLEHILVSIDLISVFLTGMDLAGYRRDEKTRSAVERQLQNLTEAAFRLGKDTEKLCPTIDWQNVRGLGNALRHEYDVIDDELIWEAIQDRLPPLKVAVQRALANIRQDDPA